jgi:predicted transcriptional regulator
MDREQIIKALECCKSPKLTKCNGCPREQEDGHCMYRLTADALALIRELTEENERLRAEVSVKKKLLVRCSELVEHIQADTVRKMQERLKSLCVVDQMAITKEQALWTIDQIAKELLEDNT